MRWCFAPGAAIAGWLLATLPLLLLGVYRPVPVVLLGLAGSSAAVAVLISAMARAPAWPRWSAVSLLLIAVVTAGLAIATHSEQVIVVRDAGTYANSGVWLAEQGSLQIRGQLSAFGGPSPRLNLDSPGFYQVDERVVPQFLPGLPMLLALGRWLGNWAGLFAVPGLVMGLAILAFGGLTARLVGPRWAPLAAAVLALSHPVLDAARQTLSEGLSLLLLISGLGLLLSWEPTRPAQRRTVGALGGLLLATACLVRIDALREVLLLVPVLAWFALRRRLEALPAAASLALMTACAVATDFAVSPPYLEEISGSLYPLLGALVLGSLLAMAGVLVLRRRPALLPRRRSWFAPAAGLGTLLLLVALALRPLVLISHQPDSKAERDIAALQRYEGLAVDGTRTYAEHSLTWVSWWLGWPTVLIAITAAAWLTWRAVRGDRAWGVVLTVLLGSAVLTLLRPAITPDHPWADRRLVPTVLPVITLLAVAGIAAVVHRLRPPDRPAGRRSLVVAVIGASLLLVPTVAGSWSLVAARTEVGQPAALDTACSQLRPDSAVLFVDASPRSQWLQALRGACGVPVASVLGPTPPEVAALVEKIRAAGREPVLASTAGGEQMLLVGVTPRQVVDLTTAQHGRTLVKRPSMIWDLHDRLWLGFPEQPGQ